MAAALVKRTYYGQPGRYEQSFDVYMPLPPPVGPLPLVILVVGSAWLGHTLEADAVIKISVDAMLQ